MSVKIKKGMKLDTKRNIIQVLAAALFNGFALGYVQGNIFKGPSKKLCVPVLNCYSCPGALGSCPIGSLQSMLAGHRNKFSFYVIGWLMLFGMVLGRAICGFLCPFGLLQGLLHKIPTPKLKVPEKIDCPLRYLKYVVLVLFVILMPLLLRVSDTGTTNFCKWICPAGTLGAGIPLLFKNPLLRMAAGALFFRKLAILIVVILLSIIIYRPFCKYICPLGAIYSLFNKYSLFQMELDKDKCVNCNACNKACLMNVDVTKNINSIECIRCGKCADTCPKDAITIKFGLKTKPDEDFKNSTGEIG